MFIKQESISECKWKDFRKISKNLKKLRRYFGKIKRCTENLKKIWKNSGDNDLIFN